MPSALSALFSSIADELLPAARKYNFQQLQNCIVPAQQTQWKKKAFSSIPFIIFQIRVLIDLAWLLCPPFGPLSLVKECSSRIGHPRSTYPAFGREDVLREESTLSISRGISWSKRAAGPQGVRCWSDVSNAYSILSAYMAGDKLQSQPREFFCVAMKRAWTLELEHLSGFTTYCFCDLEQVIL